MAETSTKSEYERLMDQLESEFFGWDTTEATTYEVYEARTDGQLYKRNIDSGDGYWCPVHGSGCYRSCDERRWGRFGAAGVLFFHRATGTFLLNQRSKAIHFGGTWSTLGGAIDRNEDPFDGALREVEEEIGVLPVGHWQVAAHEDVTTGLDGSWTYTTFVVEVTERFEPKDGDWESAGNEWVTVTEMATLKLHPGLKKNIHSLLKAMYEAGCFRQEG